MGGVVCACGVAAGSSKKMNFRGKTGIKLNFDFGYMYYLIYFILYLS